MHQMEIFRSYEHLCDLHLAYICMCVNPLDDIKHTLHSLLSEMHKTNLLRERREKQTKVNSHHTDSCS